MNEITEFYYSTKKEIPDSMSDNSIIKINNPHLLPLIAGVIAYYKKKIVVYVDEQYSYLPDKLIICYIKK